MAYQARLVKDTRTSLQKILDEFRKDGLQKKVFEVLSDEKWHCRSHEYKSVPTGQLAGGGGIQGVQGGTSSRAGFVIESKKDDCKVCGKRTVWDRWTGERKASVKYSSVSQKLARKILDHYGKIDALEQRVRPDNELIIDHRFPQIRSGEEEKLGTDLSAREIEEKFQLLKKDASGNHNLLKSRACERCFKTGKRGKLFGVDFFYEGDQNWPEGVPARGRDAEAGCKGCGWYNVSKWREELNKKLHP